MAYKLWLGGLILISVVISAANSQRQNSETTSDQEAREIQVRGRVICLAEEMHKLYDADLSTNHEHLYGFKTKNGVFYTLLRTNMSEALFVDKRLHEKELIIKGRTFPQTQILEAISLYSVHDGTIHELYYYCVTCAIRTFAPENCECCQEPVELTETPIELKPLQN